MSNSISLKEFLELQACEIRTIVSDDSCRQAKLCKDSMQVLDHCSGSCGRHLEDFQPLRVRIHQSEKHVIQGGTCKV